MKGKDFISELNENEIAIEFEKLVDGLLDIYSVNKHIPKRMQQAVRLRYIDGLTFSAIGDLYQISCSRAGQIVQKALRILRHPSRLNCLLVRNYSDGIKCAFCSCRTPWVKFDMRKGRIVCDTCSAVYEEKVKGHEVIKSWSKQSK
jgi:transposase